MPPSPRESYDLVVVGDELAGLVAATLCARRGMRVLLAQVAPNPTSYTIAGVRLPVEPLLLAGIGGPATRRVFDELHFQHLIKRKLRAASPSFQLTAPDLRLDVDADDGALARELGRELGGGHPAGGQLAAATALSAGLDKVIDGGLPLPATGFFERREVTRLAGPLAEQAARWDAGHGDAIGAALARLPAAFLAGAAPDAIAPLAAARGLELLRLGAPRLTGDHAALREVFLDKFASHAGETRSVLPVGFSTSWGKLTGLVVEGREELGANQVIAALPLDQLVPWVDGKLARRLGELAAGAEVAAYRFTLNLVLDAVGVPEGMGATVLSVVDPARPLTGGNALALHVAPPDDRARVVVTVQALCAPPAPGEALHDALVALRAAVHEHLEAVMPFHRKHVRLAHSPNQAVPAEGVDADLAIVAPARPLWRPAADGAFGLSALDYAGGAKNLTLASSQILPGLGVEGELLAGWSAARLVSEAGGKRRDFLHGEVLSSQ